MNTDLPSGDVDGHRSSGLSSPTSERRRLPSLRWRVSGGEDGFADDRVALLCLIGLLPVPVAFILADVFGLGTVGTVLVAVGLMVVALIVGGLALSPPGRRLDRSALGAVRDVLSTAAEPDPDATVRPATLADADAMVAIQWEGSHLVLAEGRRYRRFGAFDAAMRVWLTMALASDDWEVLVEVSDGQVVAWGAVDKSGAQGRAWPGPPPRRRLGRSDDAPR